MSMVMTMSDPPDDTTRAALAYLLRWYAAMGVDAAIDEVPHDRFASVEAGEPAGEPAAAELGRVAARNASAERSRAEPDRAASSAPRRTMDAAPATADALIRGAEVLAGEANTLAELRSRWETLPGCGLAATAAQMIFSGGTPGAPVLAFAGAHGRLLDAMLRAIGLDRGGVYMINVVPWRPPGNRVPTPLELALCLPFARRHVALAAPELILCLGERAAQPLLDTRDPISRLRGRWMSFEGETRTVKTLVTFSPAILLKQPIQKRRAWADLLMLAGELDVRRSPGEGGERDGDDDSDGRSR